VYGRSPRPLRSHENKEGEDMSQFLEFTTASDCRILIRKSSINEVLQEGSNPDYKHDQVARCIISANGQLTVVKADFEVIRQLLLTEGPVFVNATSGVTPF